MNHHHDNNKLVVFYKIWFIGIITFFFEEMLRILAMNKYALTNIDNKRIRKKKNFELHITGSLD